MRDCNFVIVKENVFEIDLMLDRVCRVRVTNGVWMRRPAGALLYPHHFTSTTFRFESCNPIRACVGY